MAKETKVPGLGKCQEAGDDPALGSTWGSEGKQWRWVLTEQLILCMRIDRQ